MEHVCQQIEADLLAQMLLQIPREAPDGLFPLADCVRARRTLFKKRNTQMVDARAKLLLIVDGFNR